MTEEQEKWYERETAAFRAWWEAGGEKTYSETPTMAAGAGWLKRAEAASSEKNTPPGVQEICRTQAEIGRDIKAALERTPDKSHRHTVKQLESWQQSFENLRREFHRHGNHDGQRGCEFALEAIRQYQMAEPPTEPQVVGRVWNDEGQGTAQLNSVGRALPDDTPLYSSPVSAIVPNALGTMPDNAQNIGQLNRPYEIAKQALLEQAREIAGLRASLSNDALHAWAMCEKARADAFKECAEIVESMSGVEEGRSDHATSDAAWAAIKLQDAAEKIRERAAKTNHITHALGAPTDGSIAK